MSALVILYYTIFNIMLVYPTKGPLNVLELVINSTQVSNQH